MIVEYLEINDNSFHIWLENNFGMISYPHWFLSWKVIWNCVNFINQSLLGYHSSGVSRLVISDSLWPHGLPPARLFCPWNPSGKNTGAGGHFLLHTVWWDETSDLLQIMFLMLLYTSHFCSFGIRHLEKISYSTEYSLGFPFQMYDMFSWIFWVVEYLQLWRVGFLLAVSQTYLKFRPTE